MRVVGRLYEQSVSGAATRFLYDDDELIAEYNASGTLLRRTVPGAAFDLPVVWYEGAGTSDKRYLVQDERGSVIAVDAASGVSIYSYDEYGTPNTWSGPSSAPRFRYAGAIMLASAQLYSMRARVYSPSIGRFLQTDPVGYEQGPNLYHYAFNDPLNLNDPSGLCAMGCELPWENPWGRMGSWTPQLLDGNAPPQGTYPSTRTPTDTSKMDPATQTLYDLAQSATNVLEAWDYRRQMGRSAEESFEANLVEQGTEFFVRPVLRTPSGGIRIPDFAVLGPQGWSFVEVKAGLSDPPSRQIMRDREIEAQGFTGLSNLPPALLGRQGPTNVALYRVVPSDINLGPPPLP